MADVCFIYCAFRKSCLCIKKLLMLNDLVLNNRSEVFARKNNCLYLYFLKNVNMEEYSFSTKLSNFFFSFQKTIAKIATCLELRSAALQV